MFLHQKSLPLCIDFPLIELRSIFPFTSNFLHFARQSKAEDCDAIHYLGCTLENELKQPGLERLWNFEKEQRLLSKQCGASQVKQTVVWRWAEYILIRWYGIVVFHSELAACMFFTIWWSEFLFCCYPKDGMLWNWGHKMWWLCQSEYEWVFNETYKNIGVSLLKCNRGEIEILHCCYQL